jgi:hypothetical protein
MTCLTYLVSRASSFLSSLLVKGFNLISAYLIFLLPILAYLEVTTTKIVDMMDIEKYSKGGEIQVLSKITKPFTSLIIQVIKK